MHTSSATTRRGLRLSAILLIAGVIVALIRFARMDGSNGGLLFLFVVLMAASIAVYARVALVEKMREKIRNANSVIDNAPTEHIATVTPIRAAGTSDVA